MSTEELIALLHHRWSVPVLVALYKERGARFVRLVKLLRVGRESLTRALTALIELGLVRRNPGYGHPARPEYLLTGRGAELAPLLAALLVELEELRLDEVALRKWSLPVLAALDGGRRFSELRAALPGVTARALALTLKTLTEARLVERRIVDAFPPATLYLPTQQALPLRQLTAALLR
jgi:DNA-binding HxlR family transcriptional regulator